MAAPGGRLLMGWGSLLALTMPVPGGNCAETSGAPPGSPQPARASARLASMRVRMGRSFGR